MTDKDTIEYLRNLLGDVLIAANNGTLLEAEGADLRGAAEAEAGEYCHYNPAAFCFLCGELCHNPQGYHYQCASESGYLTFLERHERF